MFLVSRRANFTFVAGAALVTTGITFAFGAADAGARRAAAPPGHGKAPAAVNGDNGTVKIHDSSTPVTDRRNEPHVCVFYLDAFGFDPGQSVSWQIKSWPPTGDRAVVDQGTLTLDSAVMAALAQAMPRALQALLDVRRRAWRRQEKVSWVSCPSSTPTPTPTPTPPSPAPTSNAPASTGPRRRSPARARRRLRRARPRARRPPSRPLRHLCRCRYPARDGLRHWALTTGGPRATGPFASAGSRASCAARPMMAVAPGPPGSLARRRRRTAAGRGAVAGAAPRSWRPGSADAAISRGAKQPRRSRLSPRPASRRQNSPGRRA